MEGALKEKLQGFARHIALMQLTNPMHEILRKDFFLYFFKNKQTEIMSYFVQGVISC